MINYPSLRSVRYQRMEEPTGRSATKYERPGYWQILQMHFQIQIPIYSNPKAQPACPQFV